MNNKTRLNILFYGARWLGIACLRELTKYPSACIVGVVVPSKKEPRWWKTPVEEDIVKKMGFKTVSWVQAKTMKNLDLVFSVLHGPIFKKEFIECVRFGVINLHPAPLPQYRGKNGPAYAIINGDRRFGSTLHYIDEGIDTGSIIVKSYVGITKIDTGYTLYEKNHRAALTLFKKTLPLILNATASYHRLSSKAQNEKHAHYYDKNSLDNKKINPSWSFQRIYDFVRAVQFPPFEPAYLMLGGKKLHLQIKDGQIVVARWKNLESKDA